MESLLFAFRYFTNLPLPGESGWNEKNAAASLTWLPLTGLVTGLCLAAPAVFFQNTGFPQDPSLKAIMIIALELWIGGTRFIDGFCKTCDAVFSRLDRKRSFEIIKDSYLGTGGVLSLILWVAAKIFLLTELSLYGNYVFVLIFYPCWTRWAVSFSACCYPAARDEGMAFFFKIAQKPVYIILSSAFLLLILFLMPRDFYLASLISFAALLFCVSLIQTRLGGQTEDTYGFAAVSAELSFLLSCAASGAVFRYLNASF